MEEKNGLGRGCIRLNKRMVLFIVLLIMILFGVLKVCNLDYYTLEYIFKFINGN